MATSLIIKMTYFSIFLLSLFTFLLLFNFRLIKPDFSKLKRFKKEDGYNKLEKVFKNALTKEKSMYKKALEYQKKKKDTGYKKLFNDLKLSISLEKKAYALGRFLFLIVISFSLAVIVSLILNNLILMPALIAFFIMIPIIAKVFKYYSKRREINSYLESALSLITTSYMQSNSVILAVKENIDYMDEPIKSIFLSFLQDSNYIYEDTKKALNKMKYKLDSSVFHEWIDIMIACLDNKDLKTTIVPVVHKLSDMRIIASELDTIIYAPLKEFLLVCSFYFLSIPLIFFLNKGWWNTIVYSSFGRIYVAISVLVILISLIQVINLTKPVEYKR